MRLDEVIWLSRVCGHGGMVEQATVLIEINYDDLIIIGATRIGIKGRCTLGVNGPGDVRRRLYERWVP
ncbi:hypothetical protein A2U01_0087571 [Trifolium medium]|uniref:Uncharacterized protein n=1 Tax=Trifolium medium TaxID=97028 RepID=A0A392TYQ4_9FABA|nr:hypothetical protein [Trifolium medium]